MGQPQPLFCLYLPVSQWDDKFSILFETKLMLCVAFRLGELLDFGQLFKAFGNN